jgi:hypothetical protein
MGLVLRLLLLLLLALCGPQCHAVRYIFLPLMGGNSPSMDLLGVAAALQARCECSAPAAAHLQHNSRDVQPVLMCSQTPHSCRGHEVTVVVTETGLAFAKQAAARHSSNTTAEAMRYVVFHMSHDPVAAGLGTILKQVRHPGRLSSKPRVV